MQTWLSTPVQILLEQPQNVASTICWSLQLVPDPASEGMYGIKKRVAEKVRIEVEHITFSETVTQEILETLYQ